MKCICDRTALQDALAATSSVTPTRTPKPILECVKLSAEKDALTLTAFDQEVGLRYRVRQVEVQSPGEMLVRGDRLSSIVRESSDETMAFETSDDVLHVRGADSHFQIIGRSVKEFPPVPELEGDPQFVVKLGALRNAVDKTLFAAARENTRYAINGVLCERHGKVLRLVATDGRRLALSEASLEKSVGDEEIHAIIPSKALSLLSRLHLDADELLHVRFAPNQVVIRSERATITSVLVEGHFPKYQDVIPKDQDKELEIKTGTFLSAVRRAALLSSMESKGIRMRLSADGVTLRSRSPEQGEAEVRVDMTYKGEEMEIGFNPEFLIDALKVCDDDATLALKSPAKPGLIKSGGNFQYVVMPVNLS
jgi:DNA polymerase-3 subunit beta